MATATKPKARTKARRVAKKPPADAPAPPREVRHLEHDLADLDPAEITASPYQVRQEFADSEIDELAQQIAAAGQLVPILVRPSGSSQARWELVDGERRLRAVRRLGLTTIRAEVGDFSDADAQAIVLLSSCARKDLNPIEEAIALQAMLDTGAAAGPTELARRLGTSQGHVSNRLRLLKLPEPWQQRVISGEMPASYARELVPFAGSPALVAVITEAIEQELATIGGLGGIGNFREMVLDDSLRTGTRPMEGTYSGAETRWQRRPIFTPTAAEEKQLAILELADSTGTAQRRATNVKLWQKLQEAHAAKLDAAGGKGKKTPKPAGDAKGEETKKLTPAQQKARAAEERRLAAERAKDRRDQLRRKLAEFTVDWRRWLIAAQLATCEPGVLTRLLIFISSCRAYSGPARDGVLAAALKAMGVKASVHKLWPAVAGLENGDQVEELARRTLVGWVWSPEDQAPVPLLSPEEVAGIADFLCVDEAAAWQQDQAGPLSRRYWELHTKDELAALGKQLNVELAGTKAALVETLLERRGEPKPLALPKELAKQLKRRK